MRKGRLEQKYKQDKARLFEPWSSIEIQRIRDTESKGRMAQNGRNGRGRLREFKPMLCNM
jgi:hypothetical protein